MLKKGKKDKFLVLCILTILVISVFANMTIQSIGYPSNETEKKIVDEMTEVAKIDPDISQDKSKIEDTPWRSKLSMSIEKGLPYNKEYVTVVVATSNIGKLHRLLRHYGGVPYINSDAIEPKNFDYNSLSYADSDRTMLKEISIPGYAIPHIANNDEVLVIFEKPEIKTMHVDEEQMKGLFGKEGIDLSGIENISPYTELGSTSDPHKVKDVWEQGFDGEGINIAIVDTGTDFSNADLINKWAVAPNGDYNGAGWPVMFDPGSMELYLTTNATGVNRTIYGGYPVGFEDHSTSRYSQTNFSFQPTTAPIEVVNESVYYRYQESHPEEQGYEGGELVTKNLKGVGLHPTDIIEEEFNATGKLLADTSTDSLIELKNSYPTGLGPNLVMDNDGWYTVGASSPFGEYNSLKINSTEIPHISYYDAALGALGYAYWDGTQWQNETVDNDGDVGLYSSLAFNSSEVPRISYFDSSNQNLKYAYWNGTSWNVEEVDTEGVGKYSSLTIDPDDRPHVFYYHETGGDNKGNLKYAYKKTNWDNENELSIIFDQGRYTSSAANGHAKHIIFYDQTNNRLRYKTFTRFNWDTSSTYIDDGGMYGSIALDSNGYPHVSHYDPASKELKYLYHDGSEWHKQVIDGGDDVGIYTSIAIDSNDNPHITYFSQQYVNHTFFDGSDWIFETIAPVGNYAHTSIDIDGSDHPHITYYSSGYKALSYAVNTTSWDLNFLPRDMGENNTGEMLDLSLDTETAGGWVDEIYLDLRYSVNTDYGNIVDWDNTNITLINKANEDELVIAQPVDGQIDNLTSVDITNFVDVEHPWEIDLEIVYNMSYTGILPGPTVNFDYINLRMEYEDNPDVYHDLWINGERAFDGLRWTGESYKPEYLPRYKMTDNLTINNKEQSTVVRQLIFTGDEDDQRNSTYMFDYPNIDVTRIDYVHEEDGVEIRRWNEENYTFDSAAGTIRLDVDITNGSKIYVNYEWNYVWAGRRIFKEFVKGESEDQTDDDISLPMRYINEFEVYYVDSSGITEWNEENYDFELIDGIFTLKTDLPAGSHLDLIYQYSYVHVGFVYDERIPNEIGIHKLNNTYLSNATVDIKTPTRFGEWPSEGNYILDRENGTIEILQQLLNNDGNTEGCYVNITYEWGRVPQGKVRELVFEGPADVGAIYHTENKNIKNAQVYVGTSKWDKSNYILDPKNGTIQLNKSISTGTKIYITYDWEYYWFKPSFDIDETTGEITFYKSVDTSNSATLVSYSGFRLWDKNLYTINKKKGEFTVFRDIENNEGISINYVCGGSGYELMKVSIPKMQYPANGTWGKEEFWTIYNMTSLPVGLQSQSGHYRFGLSKANHLANLWGEHVGMLLIDSETSGVYDQILVDINHNYDFQDEKPVNKSSPLAFTELKSWENKGIIKASNLHPEHVRDNYEFAWMGNDAENANIVLSAGLLYWISDGENSVPYADRYAEIFEYKNITIPEQGNLTAFYDDWGSHGTSTASAAAGTGLAGVKNSRFISTVRADDAVERYKELTSLGTAPNAKIIGISMLGVPGGSMEASWRFASEGYDGIPGTGDEAMINSNSWGAFADNAGWFYYDRLAMELSKEYPNTILVASAGNQGNGYGTLGSPGSSPAVITVAGGSDMAYRTYLGNNMNFLQFRDSGVYPDFGGTIGDGDPREQRPYGDVVDFSSRGPNLLGQPGVDVFATGAFAMAAFPPTLAFSEGTTGHQILSWHIFRETSKRLSFNTRNNSQAFDLFSGTSLSAPVTAGISALVYQAFEHSHGRAPTNKEIKQIIMAAADDHEYDPLQQGAGWVNATRAVEIALRTEGAYPDTEYWSPGEFDGIPRAGMANLMYPGESYEHRIGLTTQGDSDVTDVKAVVYEKTLEYTFEFDSKTFDGTATLARNAFDGPGVYRRAEEGLFSKVYDETEDNMIQTILNTTGFIKIVGMQDGDRNAYINIFNWQDANETLLRQQEHPSFTTTSGGNGILDGEGFGGEPARNERSRMTWSMDKGRYVSTYVHNPKERIHEGLIIQSRTAGYEMYGNITIEAYEKVEWDWIDIEDVSNDGFNVRMNVPEDAQVGGYQGTIIYETDSKNTGLIPVFVNVAGLPTKSNGDFIFGGGEPTHSLYSNSRIGGNGFYDSRLFILNYDLEYGPGENNHILALVEQLSQEGSISVNLYGQTFSPFSGADYGSFAMGLVAQSPVSSTPNWTLLELSNYLRSRPTSHVIVEVRCDGVGLTDSLGERFEGHIGQLKINPTTFNRYNEPVGNTTINIKSTFDIPGGISALVPEAKTKSESGLPIDEHPYVDGGFIEYIAEAPTKQIITIPEGTLSFTFSVYGHSDGDDYDLGIFWAGVDDEYIEDGIPTVDGFIAYDGNPTADETVTILDPRPGRYYCMIAGYAVSSGMYDYDYLFYVEGESLFEAWDVPYEPIHPTDGNFDASFSLGWNLYADKLFNFDQLENLSHGEAVPDWIRDTFSNNSIELPDEAYIVKDRDDFWIMEDGERLYFIDVNFKRLFSYEMDETANEEDKIRDEELPQWLIDEFANNGLSLPDYANVTEDKQDSDIFWIDIGDEPIYMLKLKYGTVRVYDTGENVLSAYAKKDKRGQVETMIFVSPGVASLALVQVINPVLVYDYEKPKITDKSPTDGALLSEARPPLSVNIEDGKEDDEIVQSGIDLDNSYISLNGEKVRVGLRKDENAILYVPEKDLPDGDHTAKFVVSDKAGNMNVTYSNFTIDTTPPDIDIDNIQDGYITTESSIEITGSVSGDTANVSYSLEDIQTKMDVVKDAAISFGGDENSYSIDIPLGEEGGYRLILESVDIAGNTQSSSITIFRDNSPPEITIDSPNPTLTVTNEDSIEVKGRVNIGDEPGNVTVSINGQETDVYGDGSFNLDVPLNDGSNNIRVEAEDEVRNEAISRMIILERDSTPPEIDWEVKLEGNEAVVSGSVSEDSTVRINGRTQRLTNRRFEETVSLTPNSRNEIYITVEDEAGNLVEESKVIEATGQTNVGMLPMAAMVGMFILAAILAFVLLIRKTPPTSKPIEVEEYDDFEEDFDEDNFEEDFDETQEDEYTEEFEEEIFEEEVI